MVCLKFYELYPSSCRALILVDTIYENPLKHMHLEADQVITPLLDHFLSYLLDNSRIHGKHLPEVPLEKFRDSSDFFIWLKSASCTSFKSLIACAKEMLHFNEKKIMSKIRVPVLILEGEKDERTPLDQAIKMARRIKDSSIRIVPGVAHDANIQDPINVSRYILEFLKGCGEHTREEKCSTGFK